MRTNFLVLGFLLFLSSVSAQGIEFFHGSWEEALEKAKMEDKPIFVDAYASWCGPCKKMAAQVFPKREVGEVFNANFIALKIDMEKPEAASFRSKNPVRAYPTLMFFDAEGNRIHTTVGGQAAKGLINEARTALKKVDNLSRYEEKYANGDRDPAFVLKYVRALIRQGKPHLKVANEQIRSQKDLLGKEDNLKLLMLAATDADSRIFDKLIEHKRQVLELFSQEDFDNRIESAFQSTQQKAVEVGAKDLLLAASKKYKTISPAKAKAYQLQGLLNLSVVGDNKQDFLKAAKKYYKKAAKGNELRLEELFQTIRESKFADDNSVQELAVTVGQEFSAMRNDHRAYYSFASWLNDIGRKKEALIAAEQAKKVAPKKQPNTQRLIDYLIKRIKE